MSAIGATQGPALSSFAAIPDTRGIFETLKDKVVSLWNAFVTWITDTWTATTFLFFRTMEYVHPYWGPKLEAGYLYVKSFFDEYFAEERETTLQRENADLQRENSALRPVAAERNHLRDQNQIIRLERNGLNVMNARLESDVTRSESDIRRLRGDIQRLQKDIARLERENGDLQGDVQGIQREKNLIQQEVDRERQKNEPLRQQIAALCADNEALERQAQTAMKGRELAVAAASLLQKEQPNPISQHDNNPIENIRKLLSDENQNLLLQLVGNTLLTHSKPRTVGEQTC